LRDEFSFAILHSCLDINPASLNCIIYARVSTERQAEKDLSLPAQLQAMREHARRHDWTIVGEFVEPGSSAWHGERPAFQALLERCRVEPKVDVVLIAKIDRFARNLLEHLTVRAALKRRGIKLASVGENLDDSSASGQLLENIMAAMSEHYSRNLSDEAKKGMRMKVERGGWPHRPVRGYRMARDEHGRSEVVIDDEAAPLIKKMFERYAAGFVSLKRLGRELSEMGLRSANGGTLAASYLREMLENPFYIGRLRWNGKDYPGRHPALIDEALFQTVQDVLRARHKNAGDKGKHRFMLRGVAFCSACGARLTAEKHDQWSYYRCTRHTVSKALCSAPFSNVERTHGEVISLMRRLRLSAALKDAIVAEADRYALERVSDARGRVNSLRMQIVRLEERELRIGDAFAKGDMSPNVYRDLAAKIRADALKFRATLREAEVDPKLIQKKIRNVVALVETVSDAYREADEEKRHKIVRTVFRRMTLRKGRIFDYSLHSPFDRLLREDDNNAPHLDSRQVTPAIKNILEFDDGPLRQLINTTENNNAA
jgi:site-specific DNA recombinase